MLIKNREKWEIIKRNEVNACQKEMVAKSLLKLGFRDLKRKLKDEV